MAKRKRIIDMVSAFTWDIANIDNNEDYVMLPALTGPDGHEKYHKTEQQ